MCFRPAGWHRPSAVAVNQSRHDNAWSYTQAVFAPRSSSAGHRPGVGEPVVLVDTQATSQLSLWICEFALPCRLVLLSIPWASSSSFLACNSYDCVAPYVDIILHRGRFWAKSAASGSVRWCCFRTCWTVLSHVMRGRPSCLLQSAGGEANRILLVSSLSSMRIICPNRVSRCDWIIVSYLEVKLQILSQDILSQTLSFEIGGVAAERASSMKIPWGA